MLCVVCCGQCNAGSNQSLLQFIYFVFANTMLGSISGMKRIKLCYAHTPDPFPIFAMTSLPTGTGLRVAVLH